MISDRTGRKLDAGVIVDFMGNGMLSGQVVEVSDNSLLAPNSKQAIPDFVRVMVNLQFPVTKTPVGKMCMDLYAVARPAQTANIPKDVPGIVESKEAADGDNKREHSGGKIHRIGGDQRPSGQPADNGNAEAGQPVAGA